MNTKVTESEVTKHSSDDDVVLSVQGVSKKFCRSLKRSLFYGVQDIASELLGVRKDNNQLRKGEFWALQDVSFELKRGECLGLIGRNGAGKTTLLKLLNNLIKPDRGYIKVVGNVSGLIALGAGFNPILTGRENVYVNGAILGLSKKEVDAKFDEIVAFSELEKFIDTPVQSYSSGMQVRLGFAVAVVLIQPDILLLDEVLAVGDIGFTLKCLNTIQNLMNDSAVIFVSHRLQHISRFCTRLLVLQNGQVISNTSNLSNGISDYLRLFPVNQSVLVSEKVKVEDVELIVEKKYHETSIDEKIILYGSSAQFSFSVTVPQDIPLVEVKVFVEDFGMSPIITFICVDQKENITQFGSGKHHINIDLGVVDLCPGKYAFGIAVMTPKPHKRLARLSGINPFQVIGFNFEWSPILRKAVVSQQ